MAVVDNLTAQNFTMRSGDSKKLNITVTDGAGAAKDLTGATMIWRLAVRKHATSEISKATASGIAFVSEVSGIAQVTIDPADTAGLDGDYYHEAQVTDSSGDIETVMVGTATIIGDHIV